MAKTKEAYICQNCGASSPKWQGQCATCGEWNALIAETVRPRSRLRGAARLPGGQSYITVARQSVEETARWPRGSSELDRVQGGGLVPGSVTLIGSDPG